MKISTYYSLLNFQNTKRFKQFLFVFTLLVFGVFSQSVSAQTVSVENNRDAVEGSATPGSFRVNVGPILGSGTITVFYDVEIGTATPGSDYVQLSGEVEVSYSGLGGGECFDKCFYRTSRPFGGRIGNGQYKTCS